jgi:hypothetical protein
MRAVKHRLACLLLLALAASAGPLVAQRLGPARFAPSLDAPGHAPRTAALDSRAPSNARAPDGEGVDVPKLALAGILGGLAGMMVGAHVGNGFGNWINGLVAGEGIGTAVGVHLANDRQGPLVAELALSVGVATLGLRATARGGGGAILLAIPVAQIASAIALEQHAKDDDP